ncbi:MAG: NAD kinase [Chitinophagales bacterium]|nr:NAD kinase [Bacteroidota bacterium]MCB9043584.1 NAD kinase [Chitinophagales bacterium]
MIKIGLYTRGIKEIDIPYFLRFVETLQEHKFQILFHHHLKELPQEQRVFENIEFIDPQQDLAAQIDYLLTFGGDGTILDAVLLVKDSQIPILGINTGRLGFLTSYNKNEIDLVINALKHDNFIIDSRTLLRLESSSGIFGKNNYALNDFTIRRNDNSTLITVHTYLNDEFLTSYWADGIIVATPTGSTGYSLSCGGPIIIPQSGNFVITPVSPHNLTVRPIVLSDAHTLKFTVQGRSPDFLCTLDSRTAHINPEETLKVSRQSFSTNFVRPKNYSFLQTLRNKLMWGADTRQY